ncbi:MAG: response regulator [Desulfuromonadaceae bacterium]|nr:response regulator [Desulfuromonadaceae bacterium]
MKKQEERRIADQELLYSTSLATAALESTPDGILIVDRGGKIARWNQKFIDIWHVPAALLEPPFEDAPVLEHVVAQMSRPDEFIAKVTYLYQHPEESSADTLCLADGRIFDRYSQPQKVGDEIVGRFWSFHDITERKRAEDNRLHLEKQLLHAQKLESLGVLAGGIAHDFNNILTSIIGNADLALMRINPESSAIDNLHSIEKAAARAADLARQMLAYSGKGTFVICNHDMNALLEEMLHILQVSISKKAVMRLNLTRPLPPVEADATQIRQIIMNLVINASEAIGDKSGVIAITTGCMDCDNSYLKDVWLNENLGDGLYVFIEIADTGCGMSKETLAKLFDPFFTTKFTGRGLGMAAVLGIVRSHKGAVKVYSEPGKGSTFKVLLPASGKPSEIFNHDSPHDHWKGSGTVLLVDDEETVRGIGAEMLKELGFTVVTANDGREAVEVYKSRTDISFVILDLTMPHMDGEQCFRELRMLNPDVKVIMSSGFSELEVTQKFVGKGLAGFIQKPYKLSVLRGSILNL